MISVLVLTDSSNLSEIVIAQNSGWFVVLIWPIAIIFFISALAETNRAPFDLTEAEAELVSGYNVEYSAVSFALFFIAEYTNIFLISVSVVILFFGGWVIFDIFDLFFFGVKVAFIAFLFIWVRATLPRYRYDQLIGLGWKVFLPLTLSLYIFIVNLVIF